jgi:hypothetical protein
MTNAGKPKRRIARKAAWKEPRLPQEQIAELALGIFTGQVFSSRQVPEHDLHLLPMIFMPLALFSSEQAKELRKHPPAMICGRMKDAALRSINGYPIFFTMQMVYAQDARLIRERYEKLQAAAKEILAP